MCDFRAGKIYNSKKGKENMKKFNPTKLLFGFLGLATFASLVGSVSGSLAWYAYSTRATISYAGTSVERTAQLQIGVVSPNEVEFDANEMQEDEDLFDGTNHYYFAPIGFGLSTATLAKYLDANNYATDYLVPVTSGAYEQGHDSFSLRNAPNPSSGNTTNNVVAPSVFYAHFQFVFRIAKNAYADVNEYLPDRDIWLTDAVAKRSFVEDGDAFKALRIFVDRSDADYDYDYIFNPSASEGGETKVGGLLDIEKNGYYDYDEDNNEIIYGEYDESVAPTKISENYQGEDEIDDVNGTESIEKDTFTAAHDKGVNYYTAEQLAECDIKTAEYKSLSDIMPIRNSVTGDLENLEEDPTSLCKTNENDHNLARVNMTIYLEGWDFAVVDNELGHLFDIGLTFEINKVAAND